MTKFFSDLPDCQRKPRVELVPAGSKLASGLEVFVDWKEPFKEGVIYYLEKDRVRGVLLWNVWGKVDAARQLISEPKPIQIEDLRR
ncbi:hypothetical protein [Pedosphaera parvula]|uniref:hypothetical protein n=1 Tax=Pedosphaera parvula TaxID=1032527 RepID=UPI00058C8036